MNAAARGAAAADPAIAALRASVTVYPDETLGVFGPLPGPKLTAKAIAVPWRSKPLLTRAVTLDIRDGVGYAPSPFDVCRPFQLVFAAETKLPPVWVNRPRVDWVEHELVYPGQRLRLFGRNLHCVAAVAMKAAGGRSLELDPVSSAPYVWDSHVPACAPGDYELLVDDIAVARLEVVERGPDPLGLRVAWANQFRWDKLFPLTAEELKTPNGSTDVLQQALDKAALDGGGVVQLPAGEFGIRRVAIPAHVALVGAGQGITVLRYLGGEPEGKTKSAPSIYLGGRVVEWAGAHPMLTASGGPVGVARLSLVSDVTQPTDDFRRIEGYVQGFRVEAGSGSFIFASDLEIELAHGSGIYAFAGSNILVQRCDITVPCAGVWAEAVKREGRAVVRECRIKNQQRPVLAMNATNSVVEQNHLIGDNKRLLWCNGEHRIADLGPGPSGGLYGHHYISGNRADGVFGTPGENDGEGFCYQGALRHAYARVTTADAASLTDNIQDFKPGSLKGAVIVIVKGKGLGQLRRIADNTAARITVEPGWDLVPDATSAYTVDKGIAAHGCIIVNNSISGVKKRAIDLYCKNYDNWIQGNTIVNGGGVFLNATERATQKRLDMAYFNVVRDNVITGQPTDPAARRPQQRLLGSDHGLGWGIRLGNIDMDNSKTAIPSIAVYGNEIRGNLIHGPMPDARGAGIVLGVRIENAHAPSAGGNILEGNEVHDVPVGIRLGGSAGENCIRANRYFLRGPDAIEIQRGGPLSR